MIAGHLNIRDGYKSDIRILQLELDDIGDVLADDALKPFLFDTCHGLSLLGNFLLLVCFEGISHFDVIVVGDRNTAFISGNDFLDIVLESSQ